MPRLAVVILFALGAGLIQPSVPMLVYMTRTATFIELFCENKDRPELECHGVCHLSKKADEAQEEKSDVYVPAAPVVPAVLPSSDEAAPEPAAEYRWPVRVAGDVPLMLAADVFHPPRA